MKRILTFVLTVLPFFAVNAQEMTEGMVKLMYTNNIINHFYVDEPDEKKIVEEGIKAMLKELDPHSTYSSPKETKAQYRFRHALRDTDDSQRPFTAFGYNAGRQDCGCR